MTAAMIRLLMRYPTLMEAEAFQTKKVGNFALWNFLKLIDPLKIVRNKLNMKNIVPKSNNMSDIIVYLAMFSTTIDNILCFMGPHTMKLSDYFSILDPIWNLGLF